MYCLEPSGRRRFSRSMRYFSRSASMSMSSGVCVGPQPSPKSVIASDLPWFAGAHVLRQLVVQIDGAALAVRVGPWSREAQRLHALLHRGLVREVLRQHRVLARVAHRGVLPFVLRFLAYL